MASMASMSTVHALLDWADSPSGRYVLDWEAPVLDGLVADMFGFHALQLGFPMQDTLRANRMPFALYGLDDTMLLAKHHQARNKFLSQVSCQIEDRLFSTETPLPPVLDQTSMHWSESFFSLDYCHLPFAAQSLDLVVLPHVLDFASNPHEVLREVERVLMPEGHVVITGFNPKSLWGMRRRSLRHRQLFPAGCQWLSLRRIKDWLKLLGFEVALGRFGRYAPLCRTQTWLNRLAWLEKAGDRWWAVAGAVYVLVAIKRQNAMRLVGPVWKTKQAKAQALAPLVNSISHRVK